jgi:hypothetical protein
MNSAANSTKSQVPFVCGIYALGLLSDQRILSFEAVDSFDVGRGHWWQLGLMILTHLKALSLMRQVSWEIYSRQHHESY